jgi:hypothetical protein
VTGGGERWEEGGKEKGNCSLNIFMTPIIFSTLILHSVKFEPEKTSAQFCRKRRNAVERGEKYHLNFSVVK